MYNTLEVKNKILNWKSKLPWITPHYALKSNPIEPIVHDVINGPYGAFDCASKGVLLFYYIFLGNSISLKIWCQTR